MVCDLEPTGFAGVRIWRVGHAPSPWQFTDWAYAGGDGRFDGRWDDPHGSYRVLYASTSVFGAFVEALGAFRADPHVTGGLAQIDADDDDDPVVAPAGTVPTSWARNRVIGNAQMGGRLARIGHSRSLACLRRELAGLVVRYHLEDLDGAAIRTRVPRGFTQHVSRFIYECTDQNGAPQFDGVQYLSRFGDDLNNIALFELSTDNERFTAEQVIAVQRDDAAVRDAMAHHGLQWFNDTDA